MASGSDVLRLTPEDEPGRQRCESRSSSDEADSPPSPSHSASWKRVDGSALKLEPPSSSVESNSTKPSLSTGIPPSKEFSTANDLAGRLGEDDATDLVFSTSPTGSPVVPPRPSVLGDYVVEEELGKGGFGRVYSGYHRERPDQKVAIKVFKPQRLDSMGRLEIEALVLRNLDHPNIVRALDFGQSRDGVYFLVMNRVDGISLDRYRQSKVLDFEQIATIFLTAAGALEYAHQQDVVHRDLKPSNLMITDSGQPVVTDFGLAKITNWHGKAQASLTTDGELIGTFGYMAPEQASAKRTATTCAVDIYGLGATLYFALTGRPPLSRDNLIQALDDLRDKPPTPPRELDPQIPPDLQLICLKCLEKSPRDRYESMADLADDLERYLTGLPVRARPPSRLVQFTRLCKKYPITASLTTGLMLVILLTMVGMFLLWRQANYRWLQSRELLSQANLILKMGDQSSERMLMQTPGALHYRYERLKQSVAFREQLDQLVPTEQDLDRDLAIAHFNLAKICSRRGLVREAHENFIVAERAFRKQLARNPHDPDLRFDLFHGLIGLDQTYREVRLNEPLDDRYLGEAVKLIDELVARYPENIDYLDAQACTSIMLHTREMSDVEFAAARDRLERTYEQACSLKARLPEPCLQWRHAGTSALALANLCLRMGDVPQAEQWCDRALGETEDFLRRPDLDPHDWMDLAACYVARFQIESLKGNRAEADEWKNLWRTRLVEWTARYPDHVSFAEHLKRIDGIFGD